MDNENIENIQEEYYEKVQKKKKREKHKSRDKKLNNNHTRRLNWKQMDTRGGAQVIKGITHRVVVVKSPDDRYFEEAIFVIRDDILLSKGADSAMILKEARRVARSYAGGNKKTIRHFIRNLPAPYFAAVGAVLTGIAWLVLRLSGV